MRKVPPHIVKVYGSPHAFRSEKRKQLRQLKRLLWDLRGGCAYFPSGAGPIDTMQSQLDFLLKDLSVKSWGR